MLTNQNLNINFIIINNFHNNIRELILNTLRKNSKDVQSKLRKIYIEQCNLN